MNEQEELEIRRAEFKLRLHERSRGAASFEEIKEELWKMLAIRDQMTAFDPAFQFTVGEIYSLEQHLLYKGIVEKRPKYEYGHPIKLMYSAGQYTEEDTLYIPFSAANHRNEKEEIHRAIRNKHVLSLKEMSGIEYVILESGVNHV